MSRVLERRVASIATTNTFLRLNKRRRHQMTLNATVANNVSETPKRDLALIERAEQELLIKSVTIYLDIDGVLLNNKTNKASFGIRYFLKVLGKLMTDGNNVYWLTTHCNGDVNDALKYITPYLKSVPSKSVISGIKATSWSAVKTQGIDFTKPFLWLDDTPLGWADRETMEKHGVLDSLVVVDVNKNRFALLSTAFKLRCMVKDTSLQKAEYHD